MALVSIIILMLKMVIQILARVHMSKIYITRSNKYKAKRAYRLPIFFWSIALSL